MDETKADQVPTPEGDATLAEVEAIRVDALYGKKKHYNAADRKHRYHLWTGIPATLINVLLGSYLAGTAASAFPAFMDWCGATLAAIATILIALQTCLNFARQAEQHRNIAARYLAVAKECSRLVAYYRDGTASISKLRQRLEELAARQDEINVDAAQCPVSDRDYRRAQMGFAQGEERYEPDESRHPEQCSE